MRKYFVSFVAIGEMEFNDSTVIERKTPIVDADDLEDITEEIRTTVYKNYKIDTIIINNWRPMELPE